MNGNTAGNDSPGQGGAGRRAARDWASRHVLVGESLANWSLILGRWRGVEWRLHVHFPLIALATLWGVHAGLCTERQAWCGLIVLFASATLHELVRMTVAQRLGGSTHCIVLGPTGGWSQPDLPPDPPPLLFTSLSGPTTYLALLVAAACGLTVAGDTDTLRLLSPFSPHLSTEASVTRLLAEQAVWINASLFLVSLLPIRPCDGAELLRGVLWPLFDHAAATYAVAHVALVASLVAGSLAFWSRGVTLGDGIPAWLPLSLLATLLLYGGNRAWYHRKYVSGIEIDELDSDDDQWLNPEWIDDDRAAVLVKQIQEKQQETIDRKRREREDQEDAQVDDILLRLQQVSFNELTEEEQAILKRASRRYRRRLGERPT